MLPEDPRRKRLFSMLVAAGVLGGALAVALVVRRGRDPATTAASSASSSATTAGGTSPYGAAGRVTVTVYDEGQPLPGRTVVFQDPDGDVVASVLSGLDGKASADVVPGSMVTVLEGTSLRKMTTVTSLTPGDAVVVGEAVDEESVAEAAGSARVRLPGPHPAATRYLVSLGVGATETVDPSAPVVLPVLTRFLVGGTKFKALAEAVDGRGEPLAFAFAWGRWDAAKTTSRGEATVALAPWSSAFRIFELSLSGAPRGATSVTARLTLFSKDEDRFERMPRKVDLREAPILRFPVPPALGTEAQVRLEIAYGDSPDRALVVRREEAMAEKSAIALGDTMLPRVSNATIERGSDVARPVVQATVGGDAARADALIFRVTWPATGEHEWTVVLAPDAPARFRLPALPPEVRAWAPDAGPARAAAALIDASFYAGFADVRRQGLAPLREPPEDVHGGTALRAAVTGDFDL